MDATSFQSVKQPLKILRSPKKSWEMELIPGYTGLQQGYQCTVIAAVQLRKKNTRISPNT
jgi:hypothetical protein